VAVVYATLVTLALSMAAYRLSLSTELPGLAAIELILLALPWSLLLGIWPVAHAPLAVAAGTILMGLALNGVILVWLTTMVYRFLVDRIGGSAAPGGADR
jgi:hypothetical protein